MGGLEAPNLGQVRNVTVLSMVRHSNFVFSGWGYRSGAPMAASKKAHVRLLY